MYMLVIVCNKNLPPLKEWKRTILEAEEMHVGNDNNFTSAIVSVTVVSKSANFNKTNLWTGDDWVFLKVVHRVCWSAQFGVRPPR